MSEQEQETDIIDNIQEAQEQPGTHVTTIADLAGYIGMFVFYVGLFQTLSNDPDLKLNGIVAVVMGILVLAFSTYGPDVFAAYHVVDKKYIINYVFYGSRMIERHMELKNDPLVIARLTEENEVLIIEDDESDYANLFRGMGINFLTDDDVDKKIAEALKHRVEKILDKKEKSEHGIIGFAKRRWIWLIALGVILTVLFLFREQIIALIHSFMSLFGGA